MLLVEVDHPQGVANFNTGFRNLAHDGKTWLGVGLISEMKFPSDDGAIDTFRGKVSISGVDEEFRYLTDDTVRFRGLRIWSATLDFQSRVVSTRMIEDALMDTIDWIETEDDSGSIEVSYLGKFAYLARKVVRRRGPTQHALFLEQNGIDPATDTGFDLQYAITDKNPAWWPPS